LSQKMSTASLYPFRGAPSAEIRRRRKTKWHLRIRFPNFKKHRPMATPLVNKNAPAIAEPGQRETPLEERWRLDGSGS
jgi:hypothetical protein